DGEGVAELVDGTGGELLRAAGRDGGLGGADDDGAQGLVDVDGDAAGGGQPGSVAEGHLEGVTARLAEGGRVIVRRVGAVGDDGHGGGGLAGVGPGIGRGRRAAGVVAGPPQVGGLPADRVRRRRGGAATVGGSATVTVAVPLRPRAAACTV